MSEIEALRARLQRFQGPARTRPLLDLAQKLSDEYWRRGPGKPEAQPLLDEAISSIDEAYGHFRDDDPMRRNVAAIGGWLHGSRHVAHFSGPADRDLGIRMIEEGLLATGLSPVIAAPCRLTLGQLYMSNVTSVLRSPDLMQIIMSGGMPVTAVQDVDRAVASFEEVRRTPGVPRELRDVAGTMVRISGAMRAIVTVPAGGTGVDTINRLMEAMKVFQDIHSEQSAMFTVVPVGTGGAFYGADDLADQDPLDRPVPLVEAYDSAAAATTAQPPRPRSRPRPAATPPAAAASAPVTASASAPVTASASAQAAAQTPVPVTGPASTPVAAPGSASTVGPAPTPVAAPGSASVVGPAPASGADPGEYAALRRELRDRVAATGDLFAGLERLLGSSDPRISLVDDVVALATAVVDSGTANRTDHLMLAAGLSLRARAAGARWTRRDLDEAADALLRAADSPRPAPPEAVRVMRRVASILDSLDSGCRAGYRLAAVLRGRGQRT